MREANDGISSLLPISSIFNPTVLLVAPLWMVRFPISWCVQKSMEPELQLLFYTLGSISEGNWE